MHHRALQVKLPGDKDQAAQIKAASTPPKLKMNAVKVGSQPATKNDRIGIKRKSSQSKDDETQRRVHADMDAMHLRLDHQESFDAFVDGVRIKEGAILESSVSDPHGNLRYGNPKKRMNKFKTPAAYVAAVKAWMAGDRVSHQSYDRRKSGKDSKTRRIDDAKLSVPQSPYADVTRVSKAGPANDTFGGGGVKTGGRGPLVKLTKNQLMKASKKSAGKGQDHEKPGFGNASKHSRKHTQNPYAGSK